MQRLIDSKKKHQELVNTVSKEYGVVVRWIIIANEPVIVVSSYLDLKNISEKLGYKGKIHESETEECWHFEFSYNGIKYCAIMNKYIQVERKLEDIR